MPKTLDQRLFDDMIKTATSPSMKQLLQMTELVSSAVQTQQLLDAIGPSEVLLRAVEDTIRVAQLVNMPQWQQLSDALGQLTFLPLKEVELQAFSASLETILQTLPDAPTTPRLQRVRTRLAQATEQSPTLAEVVHEVAQVAEDTGYASQAKSSAVAEAPAVPTPDVTGAPPEDLVPRKGRRRATSSARRARGQRVGLSTTASFAPAGTATAEWAQFSTDIRQLSVAVGHLAGELHQASNNEQADRSVPAQHNARDARPALSVSDKIALAQLFVSILALVLQLITALHGTAPPPVMVNPPPPVVSPPPTKK